MWAKRHSPRREMWFSKCGVFCGKTWSDRVRLSPSSSRSRSERVGHIQKRSGWSKVEAWAAFFHRVGGDGNTLAHGRILRSIRFDLILIEREHSVRSFRAFIFSCSCAGTCRARRKGKPRPATHLAQSEEACQRKREREGGGTGEEQWGQKKRAAMAWQGTTQGDESGWTFASVLSPSHDSKEPWE
jgi:hypothetical protein